MQTRIVGRKLLPVCLGAALLWPTVAQGQYSIDWYTVDTGGVLFATAGHFELSGTAGQPDVGVVGTPMYAVYGGFWSFTVAGACRGDGNCDGVINWRDIDFLVAAQNDNVTAWAALFAAPGPACTIQSLDTNADGHVNWRDIDPFIALMNTVCP